MMNIKSVVRTKRSQSLPKLKQIIHIYRSVLKMSPIKVTALSEPPCKFSNQTKNTPCMSSGQPLGRRRLRRTVYILEFRALKTRLTAETRPTVAGNCRDVLQLSQADSAVDQSLRRPTSCRKSPTISHRYSTLLPRSAMLEHG